MSKKILVTGGAGFIGSHVSQALLERGDQVVVLDNLNDYYPPERKRANLAELAGLVPAAGNLTIVEGDIRDRPLLGRLFVEHRFDAIVNLAAMAGVRVSVEDPHLYYDVNLIGTLNLLDGVVGRLPGQSPIPAGDGANAPTFVLASTSSVYGRTARHPFIETDTCDRPLAPYPASKRSAELLGHSYHNIYGINFTALRFFTVYGPRGRPDMMAYKVLDNIFRGLECPLYNGGKMHRDWTYVKDIAAGVVAAADRPLGYELINLGRGEPTLLADFVRMIEELAGQPAKLRSEEMLSADVSYTYADITRARELLGYDPHVSVDEGIRRFWDWYQVAVLHRKSAS